MPPKKRRQKKASGAQFAEPVLGSRVSVYWPLDKKWYLGRIAEYNKQTEIGTILYDDGDFELVNLRYEKWTTIAEAEDELQAGLTFLNSLDPGIFDQLRAATSGDISHSERQQGVPSPHYQPAAPARGHASNQSRRSTSPSGEALHGARIASGTAPSSGVAGGDTGGATGRPSLRLVTDAAWPPLLTREDSSESDCVEVISMREHVPTLGAGDYGGEWPPGPTTPLFGGREHGVGPSLNPEGGLGAVPEGGDGSWPRQPNGKTSTESLDATRDEGALNRRRAPRRRSASSTANSAMVSQGYVFADVMDARNVERAGPRPQEPDNAPNGEHARTAPLDAPKRSREGALESGDAASLANGKRVRRPNVRLGDYGGNALGLTGERERLAAGLDSSNWGRAMNKRKLGEVGVKQVEVAKKSLAREGEGEPHNAANTGSILEPMSTRNRPTMKAMTVALKQPQTPEKQPMEEEGGKVWSNGRVTAAEAAMLEAQVSGSGDPDQKAESQVYGPGVSKQMDSGLIVAGETVVVQGPQGQRSDAQVGTADGDRQAATAGPGDLHLDGGIKVARKNMASPESLVAPYNPSDAPLPLKRCKRKHAVVHAEPKEPLHVASVRKGEGHGRAGSSAQEGPLQKRKGAASTGDNNVGRTSGGLAGAGVTLGHGLDGNVPVVKVEGVGTVKQTSTNAEGSQSRDAPSKVKLPRRRKGKAERARDADSLEWGPSSWDSPQGLVYPSHKGVRSPARGLRRAQVVSGQPPSGWIEVSDGLEHNTEDVLRHCNPSRAGGLAEVTTSESSEPLSGQRCEPGAEVAERRVAPGGPKAMAMARWGQGTASDPPVCPGSEPPPEEDGPVGEGRGMEEGESLQDPRSMAADTSCQVTVVEALAGLSVTPRGQDGGRHWNRVAPPLDRRQEKGMVLQHPPPPPVMRPDPCITLTRVRDTLLDRTMAAKQEAWRHAVRQHVEEEGGLPGWLTKLGMNAHVRAFEEHEVDADILGLITVEDLKEMGIQAVGVRRKLVVAIQNLGHATRKAFPAKGLESGAAGA